MTIKELDIDPVCNMSVSSAKTEFHYLLEGITYHFCSEYCLDKFKIEPKLYVKQERHSCCHVHQDVGSSTLEAEDGAVIYTCPMHPEIREPHPGACPECGMAFWSLRQYLLKISLTLNI